MIFGCWLQRRCDHGYDLDSCQSSLCRPEQFAPRHGVYHPCDDLLGLFKVVIEIPDRGSFNISLILLVYEPTLRQLVSTIMLPTSGLCPPRP
jgi:hypothetical protein